MNIFDGQMYGDFYLLYRFVFYLKATFIAC